MQPPGRAHGLLATAEQQVLAGSSTARAANSSYPSLYGRAGLLPVQHPCAAWPVQMLRRTRDTSLLRRPGTHDQVLAGRGDQHTLTHRELMLSFRLYWEVLPFQFPTGHVEPCL